MNKTMQEIQDELKPAKCFTFGNIMEVQTKEFWYYFVIEGANYRLVMSSTNRVKLEE